MSASSARTRDRRPEHWLLCAALLLPCLAHGAELTGRFSMLGTTARAAGDDTGATNDLDAQTVDQQSVRLMLDGVEDDAEWSLHVTAARVHTSGFSVDSANAGDPFRYRELAGNWFDESDGDNLTRIGYEVDRVFYRRHFGELTTSLGRQPIDWGSGRLWQPMNVFGAFAPTALDTDFKQGIDALSVDYFPSPFAALTAVYAAAPHDEPAVDDSVAVYYRRQIGDRSELSLVAGQVTGNGVAGGAYETDWSGLGWRVEGAWYALEDTDDSALYWIAGVDYQLANGTLITVEWHDDGRGVTREAALPGEASEPLVVQGLQQQLARRVLGLGVHRDISALWQGAYTLLVAALRDDEGRPTASALHQLAFTYSVSNESDLLLALTVAEGRGADDTGAPRSEFGDVPTSMSVRLRFYF